MSEYTPGPWLYQAGERMAYFYGENGHGYGPAGLIVTVTPHSAMPPEEWEAVAALIAAAPDLLEALRGAIHLRGDWFIAAQAAIAKATADKDSEGHG